MGGIVSNRGVVVVGEGNFVVACVSDGGTTYTLAGVDDPAAERIVAGVAVGGCSSTLTIRGETASFDFGEVATAYGEGLGHVYLGTISVHVEGLTERQGS